MTASDKEITSEITASDREATSAITVSDEKTTPVKITSSTEEVDRIFYLIKLGMSQVVQNDNEIENNFSTCLGESMQASLLKKVELSPEARHAAIIDCIKTIYFSIERVQAVKENFTIERIVNKTLKNLFTEIQKAKDKYQKKKEKPYKEESDFLIRDYFHQLKSQMLFGLENDLKRNGCYYPREIKDVFLRLESREKSSERKHIINSFIGKFFDGRDLKEKARLKRYLYNFNFYYEERAALKEITYKFVSQFNNLDDQRESFIKDLLNANFFEK